MSFHSQISEERKQEDEVRPGFIEHTARMAVRDLIELHGPTKAMLLLSYYFEDERTRITRQ